MRVLLVTCALVLALTPSAAATLRSPHLENHCSSGYAYQEEKFANWTVEGCSKDAVVLSGQEKRMYFRGKLEVNGMIIEVPDDGPDLTATIVNHASGPDTGTLVRTQSTSIVFDPLVGGTRKHFVIYTGAINLVTEEHINRNSVDNANEIQEPAYGSQTAVIKHRRAVAPDGWAQAAAVQGIGPDYIDLPTTGTPKIFGLSLKDGLHGAAVTPQNGSIAGKIEVPVKLALASSGLSSLFDVNGDESLVLTDGVGMEPTKLRVRFPDIRVDGIGGLKGMNIKYDPDDDEWSGGITLDLGDLFPIIDLEMAVSAANGSVTYIRSSASNLSIPIGSTGIVLDSVRFAFDLDPLFLSVGADATAGPTVAGTALILVGGDIAMRFEPSYRLDIEGHARVLPSGNGELASGSFEFIYDANGLISVSGDARFEAAVLGIGIGAQIAGSGAYSTTSSKFNVEASADGDLLLGPLGDFNVAHAEAVVSSHAFAVCTKLLGFLKGGIGQVWDENLKVFTGCDLGPYDVKVTARAHAAQNGIKSLNFRIPRGTKQAAIEVTSDRPGPRVRLLAPNGTERLRTTVGGRVEVDADAVYLGEADANLQVIALRNPPAGRWTMQWLADEPQVTSIRIARDRKALKAIAQVLRRKGDPAGRRRITFTRTSALQTGEALQLAVKTAKGIEPLGDPTTAKSATYTYDLGDTATHEVVAIPVSDGLPVPAQQTVIGHFNATLPPRPAAVKVKRKGFRLTALAKLRKGAEAPDAWQYRFSAPNGNVVVLVGKVGKPVTINVPRRIKHVTVDARPLVGGRALG